MDGVRRFYLLSEDHFERIFCLFDLIDDKDITGKILEIFYLLGDSLPSGDDLDTIGATSDQVSLIHEKAGLTNEETELFVMLVIEAKGLSATQATHIIRRLDHPVLMLEKDVEHPEVFNPYGLSLKSALLLRAIRETVSEDRYFTRTEVFEAYKNLDPSASFLHGFPTLLRKMSERGLLNFNSFALNRMGRYLFDFNIHLTPRFVRFLKEEGVRIEDLEKVDKKNSTPFS